MPKQAQANLNYDQTDQCNFLPTPDEIEAVTAEIRAGWSPRRWAIARGERGELPVPAKIQSYEYGHGSFDVGEVS